MIKLALEIQNPFSNKKAKVSEYSKIEKKEFREKKRRRGRGEEKKKVLKKFL